jgi:hypothetical protein
MFAAEEVGGQSAFGNLGHKSDSEIPLSRTPTAFSTSFQHTSHAQHITMLTTGSPRPPPPPPGDRAELQRVPVGIRKPSS